MSGVFLDTTIVIEVASQSNETNLNASASQQCINNSNPADIAYYALKELLAGKISILCNTHNAISSSDNIGEAMLQILKLPLIAGRKRDGQLQAIATSLSQSFSQNGDRANITEEALDYLAYKAIDLWEGAKAIKGTTLTQNLGCFVAGELTFGEAQELRGPNGTFGCSSNPRVRCQAAAYLEEKQTKLRNMIDALDQKNLPVPLKNKQEIISRRVALKELVAKGSKGFNKLKCRALGDAYFVGMCPPGSKIITTNTIDFIPLCEKLSVDLKNPKLTIYTLM